MYTAEDIFKKINEAGEESEKKEFIVFPLKEIQGDLTTIKDELISQGIRIEDTKDELKVFID